MKTGRLWFHIALSCSVATAVSASGADRAIPNHSGDIAVFDRALAGAKPTDPWVKFGDIGIPYERLKLYRDRLAGRIETSPGGQPVNPNSVAPAGLTFKWPNGDVYYRFDPTQVGNGTLTVLKMQQFRDGITEWAAFANLHFIEVTTPLPPNYINVQEDPLSGGGFSSAVGMAGGQQSVQFGPNAWNRGTICHEVGHALGLFHEQQRPDRDTYVTINFDNIDPNAQANFAIISDGQGFGSPYDFYSVMHYSRNALALDPNQDTISMKPGYTQYANLIGNTGDRVLSKAERAAMAAIYGNPSSPPGAVVTNTNDSGPGSLRTSIYYAFDRSPSSSPSPSPAMATTVTFNIPTNDPGYDSMTGLYTIKPTAQLPSPGSGTTINGNGQIVLDGSIFAQFQVPPLIINAHGLGLRASNCTIAGLTIRNFTQAGIIIFSDTNDPNNSASTGNLIGGTTGAARNVIAGNGFHGIAIEDPSTTNNLVQGNYVGTNPQGTAAQGNSNAGVAIYLGAHGNTVGGTVAGTRNIISGNQNQGVLLADAGTNNNLVQGNYIGTDVTGANALPNANGYSGLDIFGGAQSNTIGGTSAAARNVISGNSGAGIALFEFNDITAIGTRNNVIQGNFVGLNATGTAALANQSDGIAVYGGAPSNLIGGSAAGAGNVVSGNGFSGVTISGTGTTNNSVQGNIIGLNPTGTSRIPNTFDGVALFGGSQFNIVGGTTNGAGNTISGNGFSGVTIGGSGTDNNFVQGNTIGLNPAGTAKLQNTFDGIAIYGGAQFSNIGGTAGTARNVISGNGGTGISLGGGQTNNNLVQGNYIGVDATGLISLGNGGDGIAIYGDSPPPSPTPAPPPNIGAQSNTIGGTAAGARNIIAGNGASGISIGNVGTNGTNNNVVQGNYIGLNAAASVVPNNFDGIAIYGGARNNLIGGTVAGARNYISGNNGTGITISRAGANNNLIQGNTIGLTPAGSIAGNGVRGIALFQLNPSDLVGPDSNLIGGTAIGASNIIAGNHYEGVALFNDHPIRNQISRNSIFSNGAAGIGRFDMSNNNQPAPSITSAVSSPSLTNPGGIDVAGSFSGTASTIEFFASPAGGDEGQFFIGFANAGGPGNFAVSLAAAIPANYVVSATATDTSGNTSAFAFPQLVTAADSDSDGIPDNWMLVYFGHTNGLAGDKSLPADDADGDGLTNAQEFSAGTDPKNASDRFAITSIDQVSGAPRVGFQPVTGKTYRLDYRDNVTLGNWITLISGIFAPNNSVIQTTDPSGAGFNTRFYRVSLEP